MKAALGIMMALALVASAVVVFDSDEADAAIAVEGVSYSQDEGLTINFSGITKNADVNVSISGSMTGVITGTMVGGVFNASVNNAVAGQWNLQVRVVVGSTMVYNGPSSLEVVTLTYGAGSGSGTSAEELYSTGQQVTLKSHDALGFTKSGHSFSGWQIGGQVYDSGDVITITGNTTATAVWTLIPTTHDVMVPSQPGMYTTDPSGVVVVEDGSDLPFVLTVDAAYNQSTPVVRVVGAGTIAYESSVGSTYTYVIRDVTSDMTIAVDTMVKNTYNVNIPTGTTGYTVEPLGPTSVTHGDGFSFKVILATGYDQSVITVRAGSETVDAVNGIYTITVIADVTINVEGVVLNSYDVHLPTGTAGYAVIGNPTVTHGSTYGFTVMLATGYTDSTPVVTVNGDPATLTGHDSVTHTYTYAVDDVSGPLTIAVDGVVKNTYTVTLGSGPNGTISSSVPTTDPIEYGTVIVITVTPDTGFYLSTFEVNGDPETVTNNTYTFAVDGDTVIYATFSDVMYDITVTAGVGGEVTPSSTQAIHGSSLTINIVADGDKVIRMVLDGNVQISGMDGKASATYTLTNISAAHTIRVEFRDAALYDVGLTVGKHGTATIDGLVDGRIVEGRTATLVVDAAMGYTAVVEVNGTTVQLTDDEYILTAQTTTVDVSFELVVIDDDDDEDNPSTPGTPGTPETPASDDSDDGDNITIIAIAAAAVAAVVAALALVALRKD